jgi:septum site-determining protein MinD
MSGQCYTVVSGKGGVGKSMLVVALGASFALEGKSVALVDVNTGMRGLDLMLGMENRIVFDLGDVLEGHCEVRQALVREKSTGMRVIAARQISDTDWLSEEGLLGLTKILREQFDVVLLDSASGIGRGFTAAVRAAGSAILLTTPDDMALRDADRITGLLHRLDVPSPQVVINRIREDLVDAQLQYMPEVCAQVLDLPICGVIPEDDQILRATLSKRPAIGGCRGAKAIENFKWRLHDRKIPLLPWREEKRAGPAVEKTGFWRRKRGRLIEEAAFYAEE